MNMDQQASQNDHLVDARGYAMARRQRVVLTIAVTCAVASTGGLVLATFVKSPAQVAAETGSPEATQLTEVVERRVLVDTLVTRGAVAASTQVEATPVVTGAGAQVVTAVRTTLGAEVHAGDVLLAVAGRPLIALVGAVPAYRDIRPGLDGEDVAQLQDALRALGYYRGGDAVGRFGPATKDAVRRLYTAKGFQVPDTGGPGGVGDRDALRAAQSALDTAQRAVDDMRRRIASGASHAPGEEPLADQLRRLESALTQAKRDQADLVARTGSMVPLSEVIFLPSLPAHVVQSKARVGATVTAPLITLAAGQLTVTAKLRPDQAEKVKPGMPVALAAELIGATADGVVESVGTITADEQEGSSSAPPYVPVTVGTSVPLDAKWAGLDVRVAVVTSQTAAPVLVVPLSAVSAGADGKTTVSRVDASGSVVRVEVAAGLSGNGFVEIRPIVGDLREGDRVVVGR